MAGAKEVVISLILVIVLIVAIVVNSLVVFAFCRVRRLRRPAFWLVLSLAVADLVGAIFWLVWCIAAAAQWDWTAGQAACEFQGYVAYLCLALNMHLMLAIAVEKFMRFWFPSKHVDAFLMKRVVALLLVGVWVFDMVIAMLPLLGWSKYGYYQAQFQCAVEHVYSASQLHFQLVIVVGVPVLAGTVLYLSVAYKVWKVGRTEKKTPNGDPVLREYDDVPKESFAEKLKRQQEKFKFAGMKSAKPQLTDEGIKTRDDEDEFEDEDEDDLSRYEDDGRVYTYEEARRQKDAKKRKKKKRLYIFKMPDFALAVTMWLAWMVYVFVWMPYIVVGYLSIYKTASDNLHTTVTCFCFLGLLCKPLVYAINRQMKTGLVLAFRRKKTDAYVNKSSSETKATSKANGESPNSAASA